MTISTTQKRIVSLKERARMARALRRELTNIFPVMEYLTEEQALLNRNRKHARDNKAPQTWSTVRIRAEIDVALTMLQRRIEAALERKVSRSELLSIAILEAMPNLLKLAEGQDG